MCLKRISCFYLFVEAFVQFDYKNFKKFVDKNDYLAYSSVEIRKKEVHTMAILFTVSMLAVAGGMICSHAE